MARSWRSGGTGEGGWLSGGHGGAWGPRRPWYRNIFVGDNPLMWAVPLGRVRGISVRVSVLMIVWGVLQVLTSGQRGDMAIAVLGLFLIVLAHEFGHCFACRAVGGEADEILMWPLGGLAMCRPRHRWRDNLITTLGGPMVNVALIPVLGVPLVLLTGTLESVVFNPLDPFRAYGSVFATSGAGRPGWWYHAYRWGWWFYYMNGALLLFNVLLVMYPMDGGRIVQALLWRRVGYDRATYAVARVGVGMAALLGVYALLRGENVLFGIALMGGLTCWQELQRQRWIASQRAEEPWRQGQEEEEEPDLSAAHQGPAGERRGLAAPPSRRAAERAQAEAVEHQKELDRILEKISARGMASLTRSEKRFLEQDTIRRRAQ
ncbi:MAG: hypothetical protein C0513_00160 [Isosphaera sp.]|nr:hypothetical protein [Isosphaera sp.]